MSSPDSGKCSKCPECGEMAFTVSTVHQIYYCFNCKAHGSTAEIARRFQGAALWATKAASAFVPGRVLPFKPKQ